MYLKKTPKKDGRIYLSIVQGYRKDGKSKSRTIQSLGYLGALKKEYADPIAHFEDICKKRNDLAKEATAKQTITIYPDQKIDMRTDNRKNIGCCVLLSHYNSLGIERVLRNATRSTRVTYDVNAIMRLLVVERIMAPGSKLLAFNRRSNYFFRSEFSDDDVYRSLDFFARLKDKIISAMNHNIEQSKRRNMTHVFYDVTNYYFEIDQEDELRRKGVEKNHRRDPIVQLGLLQDANAIPITYSIFPGNTSDCITMLPILKNLKRDYKLDRVIVVADKGLNTSDNIAANIVEGNGYVLSQSIRGTKSTSEMRGWVLSEEGYRKNKKGTFKIKSRQDTKILHIKGAGGKNKDVSVDTKTVAYWSQKYAMRARHKRAEAIEKAKDLIANPSAYTKSTASGAAKYVKNITFDKKTGEVLENTKKHVELNEARIAEEEKCDGYYCLITSETDLSDGEIVGIYQGLWKIEESFKITKSDLSTRPVYVRLDSHIEAHFLTCYIALTILRLIQSDLSFKHSAHSIIKGLSSMSGSHEQDNWWLFDYRTKLTDKLCKSVGIDLRKKRMQLTEIKSVLSQVKQNTYLLPQSGDTTNNNQKLS
jgi:transposase